MPERAVSITIKLKVTGKEEKERLIKNLAKLGGTADKAGKQTEKSFKKISPEIKKASVGVQKSAGNMGKSLKSISQNTNKLGVGMKKTEKQIGTSTKKMGYGITFLAWHFRYLGNIFDRVAKSMVRAIQDVIKVSAELQESFLSIRTAAAMYGEDAERATQFTKNLALTGLMPLVEAANSVKNLMITGLGLWILRRNS